MLTESPWYWTARGNGRHVVIDGEPVVMKSPW
jgi:hypothetical protein